MKNKENAPLVSVIIPVFNVELYLKEALESIINQSYQNLEIIIVNDGSTDESLTIAQSYLFDNRVSIYTKENGGQSSARNFGIQRAKGLYIYFFDADDILAQSTLAVCVDELLDNQLDVVAFGMRAFGDLQGFKGRYARENSEVLSGVDFLSTYIKTRNYFASPCGYLTSKALIDQGLSFIEGVIHEDEAFTFEVFHRASHVKSLKEELFYRRYRSNSTMTSSISNRNVEGYLAVVKHLKQYYSESPNASYLIKKLYNKAYKMTQKHKLNEINEVWEVSLWLKLKCLFKG